MSFLHTIVKTIFFGMGLEVLLLVGFMLLLIYHDSLINLIKRFFQWIKRFFRKNHSENQKALDSNIQDNCSDLYVEENDMNAEKIDTLQNQIIELNKNAAIPLKIMPDLSENIQSKLIPIEDKETVASITQLIPAAAKIIENASAVAAYQNIASSGAFYQAILPSGAELMNSSGGNGLVRGMYRGATGIGGHANLKSVDEVVSKLSAANMTNLAFSVMSMIVGQYYLTNINRNLKKINVEISKISGFLHNEYYSKVKTLAESVQKETLFFNEIVNYPEQREREIRAIQDMERECIQLLNQANSQLSSYKSLRPQSCPDYETYETMLYEAQGWHGSQQVLCEVLYNIENLNYAFNLGKLSKEQCFFSYQYHSQESDNACKILHDWHDQQIERLGVDLERERRRRTKNSIFSGKYCPMDSTTVRLINRQRKNQPTIHQMSIYDPFIDPMTIYIKGQSVYYLPDSDIV